MKQSSCLSICFTFFLELLFRLFLFNRAEEARFNREAVKTMWTTTVLGL